MRANERALLSACIDTGIYAGWIKAHKHDDAPHELRIAEEIENAIWYEIDQYFVFDSEQEPESAPYEEHYPHGTTDQVLSMRLTDEEIDRLAKKYCPVGDEWKRKVDLLFENRSRHCCPDWDFLEITEKDPEFQCCTCPEYRNLRDEVAEGFDHLEENRKWEGLKWYLFEENGEEYFFPASTDAEALESAKKRGATLVREATKCEYTCEGNREWVGLEGAYEVSKIYPRDFLDGAKWAEDKLKELNT